QSPPSMTKPVARVDGTHAATDNMTEEGMAQSPPPVTILVVKVDETHAETDDTIETEVSQSLLPVTPPVVQAVVRAAPMTRTPLGPLSVNIAGSPKKKSEKAGT